MPLPVCRRLLRSRVGDSNWVSRASGPLLEMVVFRASRATIRFVQSYHSHYSTLRSVFDRRFAPKTPAKPRFQRFSTSIDFESRADDSLDDRVAHSRLPQHPSTFDCRSRPLFRKSSFFFEVALFRESFPLPKAIFQCREPFFPLAKSRNRFSAPFL